MQTAWAAAPGGIPEKGASDRQGGTPANVFTLNEASEKNEFMGHASLAYCGRLQRALADIEQQSLELHAYLLNGDDPDDPHSRNLHFAQVEMEAQVDPNRAIAREKAAEIAEELAASCHFFSSLWEPRLDKAFKGAEEFAPPSQPYAAHPGGPVVSRPGLFPAQALEKLPNVPPEESYVQRPLPGLQAPPHLPPGVDYNPMQAFPSTFPRPPDVHAIRMQPDEVEQAAHKQWAQNGDPRYL